MAINKKLIHFKNKENFNTEVAKGNILNNSIVFILDTKEIYTHGTIYDGSTFDPSDIEASILEINNRFNIPSKYEFVDLGLPSGTKWAAWNVGASKPEEYGLYFAWGETEGYEGITDDKQFKWSDYKLCNGSYNTLTKYINKSSYGTVDNLTVLEQVDDAAYQSDKTCRMPTRAELEELYANTTNTWETLNGVNGKRFTSKTNGNSIFVPAAGNCDNGSVKHVGSNVYVWSSSLYESLSRNAWYLLFNSDNAGMSTNYRCNGLTVRAVQPADIPTTVDLKELKDKTDLIETEGDGTKYLSDDGSYKEIVVPEASLFNGALIMTGESSIPPSGSTLAYNIAYLFNLGKESGFDDPKLSFGCPHVYRSDIAKSYAIIKAEIINPTYNAGEDNVVITYIDDETNEYVTLSKFGAYTCTVTRTKIGNSSYLWDGTTSETIFNELLEAIDSSRPIYYYGQQLMVVMSGDDIILYSPALTDPYIGVDLNNVLFKITKTKVTKEIGGSLTIRKFDRYAQNEIQSNTYRVFGVLTENITIHYYGYTELASVSQYQGEFSFGDTVYTVTFPNDITWITYPTEFKANTTYQFEITNNIGKLLEVGKGEIAYKSDININSTNSLNKLFLIGATSQAANPQTYSHDTAYVGTDGCLYSNNTKVLTAHLTIKLDGVTGATVNRYAACSTAAGTAAKTANVTSGTFSLEAGARVTVKFTNANTANSPTLNINSTGAKAIYHKGAVIGSGGNKALLAGIVDFVYDGTQYHLVGNYIDTNTTYTLPAATTGALGGVKSGGDVTVGSDGIMSVVDDSHNHVISNIDNLLTALDAKAPLASPALTGNPTAPTQTAGNNSTRIATTAFVQTAITGLNALLVAADGSADDPDSTEGQITVHNTDSNTNYKMVFHSGNTAYSTAGIYCNASTDSIYATHYYETSDANYKTNIKAINNSNNIPEVREFDWKEDGSHSYGFIAQELEARGYDELVSTDEVGKLTVMYSATLSLVVGKMQKKIEELELKIMELESKPI